MDVKYRISLRPPLGTESRLSLLLGYVLIYSPEGIFGCIIIPNRRRYVTLSLRFCVPKWFDVDKKLKGMGTSFMVIIEVILLLLLGYTESQSFQCLLVRLMSLNYIISTSSPFSCNVFLSFSGNCVR